MDARKLKDCVSVAIHASLSSSYPRLTGKQLSCEILANATNIQTKSNSVST